MGAVYKGENTTLGRILVLRFLKTGLSCWAATPGRP